MDEIEIIELEGMPNRLYTVPEDYNVYIFKDMVVAIPNSALIFRFDKKIKGDETDGKI